MGIAINQFLYLNILKKIPSISLEIEYDSTNNGYYNNSSYELQYNNCFILIELNIESVRNIIDSDYYSPAECHEVLKYIDVGIKEIWINEDEYFLSKKQNNEFMEKIIAAIN